jgi:glycosyltransferase involved in cell wall biosynthesis
MKLLWVKADFLHPTNRGGQIRTLEMLKRLHARHEIHYIALNNGNPAGVARSSEYCSHSYPIDHHVPEKYSIAFTAQLLKGLVSPLPVAVSRYRSNRMKLEIEKLLRRQSFDCIVCDFLFPSPNIPDLGACVLFQHNVEATIWERHAKNARTPAHRFYFNLQASRMRAYEGNACRSVKSVISVSGVDADLMRERYGVKRVSTVPTGVDIDYFAPPSKVPSTADLVFVGSMDWMPNIDGAMWFVREILPLIRRRRPHCTVTFVGRKPTSELAELPKRNQRIQVTGTVPDVRPYLWGAAVSVVPLRIGSGTRLKIFESMAARVPVVSTAIGAEGLPIENAQHLYIADTPQAFAERCLELIENQEARRRITDAAWDIVSSRFSWESVSKEFEGLLAC